MTHSFVRLKSSTRRVSEVADMTTWVRWGSERSCVALPPNLTNSARAELRQHGSIPVSEADIGNLPLRAARRLIQSVRSVSTVNAGREQGEDYLLSASL